MSWLWHHELQHVRPPCPSPTLGVYPNAGPLNQWCHPTISSSVIPFSSCLQSFPASGSFPMSQFFRTRWPKYWSFSFSINPSNEYSGLIFFRMTGWISLQSVQGTLKSRLQHHSSKASVLWRSLSLQLQLCHPYMTQKIALHKVQRTGSSFFFFFFKTKSWFSKRLLEQVDTNRLQAFSVGFSLWNSAWNTDYLKLVLPP